jgi:phage replication-related protein YjqB (UPF0714/DUF867 family)
MGLAILAPHGGFIEEGSDVQAELVYKGLAPADKPVQGWIARGFNSAVGAHTCWHITSSEVSEHSFPKLRSLFGETSSRGPFAHAVAFHGYSNGSDGIVIGGGLPGDAAHPALKHELSSMIQAALRAVTENPPAVEVRLSGPLAGSLRRNVVNRVAANGNGIQLEQPLAVREDEQQREAIAGAVAAFYANLIKESPKPA